MRIINPKNLQGKRLLSADDVSDAVVTIRQGGVTAGTFSLNQTSDIAIDLAAGEGGSASGLPAQRIAFTGEDQAGVVEWNGAKATFAHQLDGHPQAIVFDADGERVLLDAEYPDDSHLVLDFVDKEAVTGEWLLVAVGVTGQMAGEPSVSGASYRRIVELSPDQDAELQPGKVYTLQLSKDISISAASVPAGYETSCDILITLGGHSITWIGITPLKFPSESSESLCTIRWIGQNAYLTQSIALD